MKKVCIFVAILILGLISVANGDSFRCGNRVIRTGDSKMDVLSKCGPPDSSEIVSYDTKGSFTYGGGMGQIKMSEKKVEKLFYNCGDGRVSRIVTIIDGKVAKIETGGYGSGPTRCE